jgi:hypothetical protein
VLRGLVPRVAVSMAITLTLRQSVEVTIEI